jgi:dienelactone hydrolase
LAILNHGPRPSIGLSMSPLVEQSEWFVQRGFVVVVPSRRGFTDSSGPYAEDYGGCDEPHYIEAAMETAADIQATLDFMSKQPYVDKTRVLLVGHSSGAFGSLALASQRVPGIVGVVNFAGGRGVSTSRACSLDRLRAAFAEFGKTSKVPSLWLYAVNDYLFGPDLAHSLYDSYLQSGGQAEFVALPAQSEDPHFVFSNAGSTAVWGESVDHFLSAIGFAKPGGAKD